MENVFLSVVNLNMNTYKDLYKDFPNVFNEKGCLDTYGYHKLVYSLFDVNSNPKFVFNKEKEDKIYIYSNVKPLFSGSYIDVYKLDFNVNDVFSFEIAYNASKKSNGKRFSISTEETESKFRNFCKDKGFLLSNNIKFVNERTDIFSIKNGNKNTVHKKVLIGLVKITDVSLFTDLLVSGIGRNK